ncbi:MAG: hypothetical protein Q9207_007980 [Kuettlingeria erythrocarpa]
MRLRQTAIILCTLLCFLTHATTIPVEHRRRDNGTNNGVEERRLELRRRGMRRLGHWGRRNKEGMEKYFHEPGGSELGNHYDSRYHHGIQDYADRKDTQLHMLRAYLTFFNENNLETWLAHGTLLGWWWNGKVLASYPSTIEVPMIPSTDSVGLQMLPWDWDIDTQVSGSTLAYMSKHYNNTHYDYVSNDEPPVKRTYLLDVNPASVERERGNGLNIIDARWIDTRNGLYIDITGLSETHPDDQPGVWACKNYHRYHTTDLYPMRETMYEGVVAKVPYAYDRILIQEYEETALVLTDYEGHRWDPIVKEWLQKSDEEAAEDKKEKIAKKVEKAKRKIRKMAKEAKEAEAMKRQEAMREKEHQQKDDEEEEGEEQQKKKASNAAKEKETEEAVTKQLQVEKRSRSQRHPQHKSKLGNPEMRDQPKDEHGSAYQDMDTNDAARQHHREHHLVA